MALRWRQFRLELAASPWLGWGSRLLAAAAGVLLIVGPLQPWAYMPLGGLRLPLYGLFGLGGLVLAAGFWLLLQPAPRPLSLLIIAAGAGYLAWSLPAPMLARAQGSLRIMDAWLDPLNQLLDRLRLSPIQLTDRLIPAARLLGPGARTTLWGAGFAAVAAIPAALALPPAPARPPRSCPACRARLPRGRALQFCPHCGRSLTPAPVCARCTAVAEAGDRFCGRCGALLVIG